MNLEMSRFVTFERGFGFSFIPEQNKVITKLTHPDFPELDIQVWNVSSERNEQKPGYIQTVLSICRFSVGIHIQSLVKHYRAVRRLGIDLVTPNEAILRTIKQSKKLNWDRYCKESDRISHEVRQSGEDSPRSIGKIVAQIRPTDEIRIEKLREEIEKSLEDHFLQSAGEACYRNEFERFVEKHLPVLPIQRYENWKRHLSWLMNGEGDRDKVFTVLTYLYKKVPKWMKVCQQAARRNLADRESGDGPKLLQNHISYFPEGEVTFSQGEILQLRESVYIPERRGIPYSFEYRRDGTLLMQYTYQPPESGQMQCLEMNLDTGESVQWMGFQPQVGERIAKFHPFEDREGLIRYLEFYDRGEFLKVAKHEIYDTNLWDYSLKRQTLLSRIAQLRWRMISYQFLKKKRAIEIIGTFQKKISELKNELKNFEFTDQQKENIAIQLLNGLLTLQGEGYVHFGIFPPSILIRSEGKNQVKAVISNYEYLYSYEELPERDFFSHKWQSYFPQMQSIFRNEIKSPLEIPIYELGCCLKLLYGNRPSVAIQAMIDGMTQIDRKKRWNIGLALAQLMPNPFDVEERAPSKKNAKEFELRSVTSFSVPSLSERFIESDERKE